MELDVPHRSHMVCMEMTYSCSTHVRVLRVRVDLVDQRKVKKKTHTTLQCVVPELQCRTE